MKNFLAGVFIAIEHDPVSRFLHSPLGRYLFGREDEFACDWRIFVRKVRDLLYVAFRYYERVERRLRPHILKCRDIIVFVYDLGGDLLTGDLTEYAGIAIHGVIVTPSAPSFQV